MCLAEEFLKDQLKVKIFKDRVDMGKGAAAAVGLRIKELLEEKEELRMVFAAAPSQQEFLDELINIEGIDWSRIVGFHLDEYMDNVRPENKFGRFLKERLFSRVEFKKVYYIDDAGGTPEERIENYSALLKELPIDIACIGIGENGHIAFNDPHVADFTDTSIFKEVILDKKCRIQQLNDGCFESISMVPEHALTMTVPSIYSADYIYCMVPGANKSEAVRKTLQEEISPECPATILRCHQRSILFIDRDAANLL